MSTIEYLRALAAALSLLSTLPAAVAAQPSEHTGHEHAAHEHAAATAAARDSVTRAAAPAGAHDMWMQELGRGWQAMGMAQVFPIMTAASDGRDAPGCAAGARRARRRA